MRRVGGLLPLLLMGLGLFAAIYLLFGDGMTSGLAGGARDGSQGAEPPSFLAGSAAELEAKGTTRVRKSAADKAADDAKKSEADRLALKPVGVHGLVLDGRGQPIAKATVKLLANPPHLRYRQGVPDGPALDTTITNDKGEFIVGPSPENGYAKVRAEAPGYAPTIQPVRTRGARADLILERGGALQLKLLDAQGKRVAGAEVIPHAGTVVTAVATTDDGMAHFAALPTGTGSLVVTKPGYGAVRDGNVAVAPGETEERTLILPDAIEVEGSVVDAETQRPLAGALVTVRYQNLPSLEDAPEKEVATTDEEGRFKLTLSVSGQENALVRASLDGYAEGRLWRNAQARGELQLKLVPAGEAIEGTVLSEDRQPLKGVRLTFQGQQQEDPAQVPEATSGEDGSFVLRLPPWAGPGSNWNVVAVSQEAGIGYARASVPAKGKAPAKPLEITLAGVGTVKGVVTDGAGAPLPGAVVSLAPDWAATQNRPGRKRQPWQLLNIVNDGSLFNLSTVSGTDGRYAFTGVPAMDYKISASLGLDSTTAEEAVELSSDETAEADIKLGEGLTIEGWILDPEDKPIPGAYVNAQPKQRTGYGWWMNRASARSQSDGKFVLRGVTDKEYTVSANASGFGGANEQNVTGGDKELRLVLKARGWIVGVVRSDGSPYRGMFTVSAQRRNQGSNNNRMFNGLGRGGQQTRTFNTDDGRFEMKGLGAGEYRVTAKTSDGLISLQEDVVNVVEGRGSREARIELTTGAVVTGQVRDDETGRGMPNMWVYANPKANPGGSPAPNAYSQTDAQGRFELKGLGTATYTI
ncbi:MAG: carboxypeptidase-like regulatory domain-containing protein, partial [Planctomycetota bacterium]|nr:carboxypeptidase-like regulatory domain-containing protein [Planctomycetota bacterium]